MPIQTLQVQQLKLTNYKNYTFQHFVFGDKLNFIVGKNGIGKTTLLDAIYYTCFTKSYLTSSDILATNFDSVFFRIETNLTLQSDNQLVEVKYLKQEKKEILLNNAKIERLTDFVGQFPCVIITPDDNQFIIGTSELRRKFLDATISQFSAPYLQQLMLYNKIITQRNAYLKSCFEHRNYDSSLLEIYNQQLVQAGNFVFNARKQFIHRFIPIFHEVYHRIFNGNEQVQIRYESDLNDNDFEILLRNNENQDRQAQRTTRGIHTDDLVFELNQFPIRKTGSQGQQKTFLLSLKLAQYQIIQSEKQIQPLLLLDDIFDKLDTERIAKIFQLIHENSIGQVFISDTDIKRIQDIINTHSITQYNIIQLGETAK
ncbi:MAG: DNA replication and repair protein RecF [Chitinophagales bacterium]